MLTPLPPPFSHEPFAVADAVAAGVPLQRLRRRDIHAPYRGVRSVPPPVTLAERCRAILPVLAPDQHVSHTSSLLLWNLPLPSRWERRDALVHVTSRSRREPRRVGVAGHRLRESRARVVRVEGVPVSAPVDAWVESASLLSVDELIVVGDAMVSRWSPLPVDERAEPAMLRAAALAAPGRGRQKLVVAAESVRQHSRSPAETRLRLTMVRWGLPEPELNFDVVRADGSKIACVDMAYPAQRLAIEYEGAQHFSDARKYHHDIERRERLAEAGWRTVRITKHHLDERPDATCRRIAGHLDGRLQ